MKIPILRIGTSACAIVILSGCQLIYPFDPASASGPDNGAADGAADGGPRVDATAVDAAGSDRRQLDAPNDLRVSDSSAAPDLDRPQADLAVADAPPPDFIAPDHLPPPPDLTAKPDITPPDLVAADHVQGPLDLTAWSDIVPPDLDVPDWTATMDLLSPDILNTVDVTVNPSDLVVKWDVKPHR